MKRLSFLVVALALTAPTLVPSIPAPHYWQTEWAIPIPRLFTIGLQAQESVNLTTPIVRPSTTSCTIDELHLYTTGRRIVVDLICVNGNPISKQYDAFSTPTGATLLNQLNTSNNSAGNSLIRKVYTRLITDGVISGTITGVAQ